MQRTILIICVACIAILFAGCSRKEEVEETNNQDFEVIEGVWEGAIEVPEQPLPIIIKFKEEAGTISIPVQGLIDYPISLIQLTEDVIFFEMELKGQEITFNGNIKGNDIAGTFTQQGQNFKFHLVKEESNGDGLKDRELEAEQGESVELEVEEGVLKGVVLIPEGEGPFPVMVIHAGSGPTDKDGNSLTMGGKNDGLKMIAQQLAEHQIASIRYDKRGIGENTALGGKEEDFRFEDYIEDATSWLKWAKDDSRFSEVGIIGHSEGSLIGMIAAQQAEADIYISLAGPGRPFDDVLMDQLEEALPEKLLKESKEIIGELKEGNEVAKVNHELQSIFRPSVQPYLRSIMAYNPAEEIVKLKADVLIVNGKHDLQVPVKEAEILHEARPEAELLVLEEMNHVLKDAPKEEAENLATYTNPEIPLANGLMAGILKFMEEVGVLED